MLNPASLLSLTTSPTLPSQRPKAVGDAYLRLELAPTIPALLPMDQAQEVVVIPTQRLTPIPNMPAHMLGLINRRSRVLWLVDLVQMLGMGGLNPTTQQYNVVVVRSAQTPIGLALPSVQGVARFSSDLIQSLNSPNMSDVVQYLRGCILENNQVLLILDAEAIVGSPVLHPSY